MKYTFKILGAKEVEGICPKKIIIEEKCWSRAFDMVEFILEDSSSSFPLLLTSSGGASGLRTTIEKDVEVKMPPSDLAEIVKL